jgi:hypothetical protein
MDIFALTAHLRSAGGNSFINVWHYQGTVPSTSNAFEWSKALLQSFAATNEASFLKLMAPETTLDFYSARRVSIGGGTTATLISASNGSAVGSAASSGLGANIAWVSNANNNRFARTIVAGLTNEDMVGEAWTMAFTQNVQFFVTAMTLPLQLGANEGDATFCQYTKKTKAGTIITDGLLRPKPTMLNKRTLPVP